MIFTQGRVGGGFAEDLLEHHAILAQFKGGFGNVILSLNPLGPHHAQFDADVLWFAAVIIEHDHQAVMVHAGKGTELDGLTCDTHLALAEVENLSGPSVGKGHAVKQNRELATGAAVVLVPFGHVGGAAESEDISVVELQVDTRCARLGRVQPDQSPHAAIPQRHAVLLLLDEAVVPQVGGGDEIWQGRGSHIGVHLAFFHSRPFSRLRISMPQTDTRRTWKR